MDDTQASLKASEAAAATRKRRSSILKSQRPPRTPFSELEFNVATPTDTAKSRRVSFSRRTGVAEFVTNEATTTWKNFYEEHNKSLESSGNESAANARPVIEHIGKRIFDQQFEEIEVVDIGGTLQTNAVHEFQTSLSNVNLHTVECTDEIKLCAPIQNFDLSSLTEHHSKVFGDDLSVPVMTEMSNPININFSNIQPMGSKCDDLEEIQRDLERSNPSNIVCQGPFVGRRDLSEYIEIDLNMTNIGVRNEDCDMSITDTIQSPKVQEVVKINTSSVKDKKPVNDDWAVDKENIVLNPYTTPKESLNFAINEEPNEVLVFDGKKLTVQMEKKTLDVQDNVITKMSIVPKDIDATPKRKTIVLNTNDDLPNFIPDSSLMVNQSCPPKDIVEAKRSVSYNDFDLSITQAVNNKIDIPKRKTIVFDDDMGNISITQAVPAKVIIEKQEKRKTILFENEMNLSMTQAVPTNIISASKSIVEKRKTIVFEDGDISFTKALPVNLILNENMKPSQDKTLYFQDGLDISVTQAIPENIIANLDKGESVINNLTNLSMIQAIPSNIISNDTKNIEIEKEGKTIIYGNQDMDATQIVSDNALLPYKSSEKRKTIVYEQDAGNISITQAVPANILLDIKNNVPNTNISKILENTNNSVFNIKANLEPVKTQNSERDVVKNKTIYDDEVDVSFTKAIPTNILQSTEEEENAMEESCDISITRALPTNILPQAGGFNKDEILKTVNNTNIIIPIANKDTDSIVNLNKITVQDTLTNVICNKSKNLEESKFYNNDLSNISITKPIPTEIFIQNEHSDKSEIDANKSIFKNNKTLSFIKLTATDNVLQYNKQEQNDMETSCDISMTRALPTNIISQTKESNMADIFEPLNNTNITAPVNIDKTTIEEVSINKIGNITKLLEESKFYSNDVSNLSMTKPIPTEIIELQNEFPDKCEIETNKSIFKDNNASVNQDILIYQAAKQNVPKSNNIDRSYNKIEDDRISSNKSLAENESNKHDLSYSFNKSAVEKEFNNKRVNYSIKKDKTIEEKQLERESLNEMELMSICTHKSVHIEQNMKPKKSILNELLDMSTASINEENNGPILHNIEANTSGIKILTENIKITAKEESNDSIFVIKDSENDMNIEKIKENKNSTKDNILSKDKDESDQDMYLQQKVDELKSVNEENRKSLNRHYENVVSSDLRKSIEIDKSIVKNDLNISRVRKSFKNADDTKELLEMLSDFTDCQAEKQDKNKSVAPNIKDATILENKSEPTRFSIIPKRQSIALSREDLLNNISMAQAALQQSRFEIDESGSIEDTHDSPEDEEDCHSKQSPQKTVRMSTDVVKTLQFEEDDTVTDVSMNADIDMSPLKKTTFGEVSYIKDDKARVIPTYLKDVSDGIKTLMRDLVKPMADTPHETDEFNKTKNIPSTCSTQIQANLITTSQIDIDVELRSTPDSVENVESRQSIVTEVAAIGNKAITNALRQSIKPISSHVSLQIEQKPTLETKIKVSIARQSVPGPVIQFDHSNPLNNILLTQNDCTKVHKYNPISSNMDTENDNFVIDDKNKVNKLEVENISLQYNVESKMSRHQSILQSEDTSEDKCEFKSVDSKISKPLSVDRSTEGIVSVKDTEVNTVIAMKGNEDLLESNSSLTLVDDALAQSAFDIKVETVSVDENQKSPLQVIYKMETDEKLHKIDSDLTSTDDFEREDFNENQNTRKRSYSPTKDKNRLSKPNVEITPKPLSKMQKISNSPQMKLNTTKTEPNKSKLSPDKKSPKKSSPKRKDVVTVQQLISECYRETIDEKLDKHMLQVIKDTPSETLATETLSRLESATSEDTVSLRAQETEVTSVESREVTVVGSNVSRVDWQPEVIDDLSSKNLLTECSSSANVVAKINTLPFMGSRDCEWESSGGDVWMFRLFRSRIRLTVRLAHSHHNASRSRVRADTALVAVTVDPVQEEKDPLAALCVRLASESMRHECSRCVRAGDVPTLLRRCVSVVRVALLWARVMRDARVRLAYSVTDDGVLILKVANVPLRAVWEVRLAVELAGESGVAWPRVAHARVEPVLAGSRAPSPPRLARLVEHVPGDWGHVPAVLWKVFRYLKNKTREDDLLGF